MCPITPETANVCSSYNRMRGPGIGCQFSDCSNCSQWNLTLTFTLTSENLSLCTTLFTFTGPYTTMQRKRGWHLDSNYCRTRCRQSQLRFVLSPLLLHPRLLGMFQSDIPLYVLTWPAKHSPNEGWESNHRLHLYSLAIQNWRLFSRWSGCIGMSNFRPFKVIVMKRNQLYLWCHHRDYMKRYTWKHLPQTQNCNFEQTRNLCLVNHLEVSS